MSIAIPTIASAYYYDEPYYDEPFFWGLSGIFCLIIIIPLIIFIVLAIWVYKDAERRGSSGILWLIIVFFTGIIGLIIWLVVRPPIGGHPQAGGIGGAPPGQGRMCPNCGRPIPMDASVCPYCGKDFRMQE
jgi:hypothetical protein